jgi:hypothetical protein
MPFSIISWSNLISYFSRLRGGFFDEWWSGLTSAAGAECYITASISRRNGTNIHNF